ncbi:MAG TPA: hypothetical protein PL041_08195 [Melioribacteraceae bacterium]|nr:hypothetical protein [Melioribacteraceae bacterium]
MVNIIFIIILVAHAIAHLPGFVMSFKLAKIKELPYSTKVFFKKIEIGEIGIKIYGLIWLVLSLIFFTAVILIIFEMPVFKITIITASILSFLISVLGLPETKFGIIINSLIIFYLIIF